MLFFYKVTNILDLIQNQCLLSHFFLKSIRFVQFMFHLLRHDNVQTRLNIVHLAGMEILPFQRYARLQVVGIVADCVYYIRNVVMLEICD